MLRIWLLSLLSIIPLIRADQPILIDDDSFDNGDLGHNPTQEYLTVPFKSPRFNLRTHGNSPPDYGFYTAIAPHGHIVGVQYLSPMIYDEQGSLVWAIDKFHGEARKTYDVNIQQYKGKSYITFWVGDDRVRGHGEGHYFMYDTSYRLFKKFTAGNGLMGDLHEFKITEDDTALITIYQPREADLRKAGLEEAPDPGHIWDCLFQEYDLETDEVLFQWRASDHYPFTSSFRPLLDDATPKSPWDWFHINSIQKDEKGNYLISSRYLSAMTYIDGKSGEVIWTLGGKQSNFKDLSDGRATNFNFQHHARFRGEDELTFFDNGADYKHPRMADYSRGMRVRLDTNAMTVELLVEYFHPQAGVVANSQGSLDILPNGNVLIGWGGVPAVTEHHPNGTVIRAMHFGPASRFGTDDVQSYRAYWKPWKGKPLQAPALIVNVNQSYVSWNGATEVKQWRLEHSETGKKEDFEELVTVYKAGFETEIPFDERTAKRYMRATALNKDKDVMRKSNVVDWASERTWISTPKEPVPKSHDLRMIIGMAILLVLLGAAAQFLWRTVLRKNGRTVQYGYSKLLPYYSRAD